MGKNARKTPSRGGKWKKISEKRFPAAGNGKNPPKNAFVRREGGKICWRSVSRGGKRGENLEKRLPAAGRGKSPPVASRRGKDEASQEALVPLRRQPQTPPACQRPQPPKRPTFAREMTHITLITGGQRSGKSSYAERVALSLSARPVYMATARVWDDEFRRRVERHQASRGPQWTNIEEEKALSRHDVAGRVVVVDCVTLWCTNFFFDLDSDVQAALAAAREEFDRLTTQDATFLFVTNEIGLGGVSENKIQRRFTDLQGWMNQYIAERADEVVLMVSGIPVKVK